jgi:arylsulfatase A-like enzyme
MLSISLLLAAITAGAVSTTAKPSSAPSILVVLADDVGVEAIGAYGEGEDLALTPNLDALAARGVLFRNAYANPVCSPSRALLMTGRYSSRTGIGRAIFAAEDGGVDPCTEHDLLASEVTLAELLISGPQGYTAAAFGKWHLNNACAASGGFDCVRVRGGFQHFAGVIANFNPRPVRGPTASDYFCWPKVVDGAIDCGTECCAGSWTGGSGHQYRAVYATSDNVDDALAWIAQQPASRPWLCYVAFNAAHSPLQAPPSSLHSQSLVYPVGHPLAGQPVPEGTLAFDLVDQTGGVVDLKAYFKASLEALDREIGRLLASVPGDATVIFLGDNGSDSFAISPPFDPRHSKGTLYEGGVRVPLIAAGPLVAAPDRESSALVVACDVYATAAELAGTPPPSGVTIDGVSFAPVLFDPLAPSPRAYAFTEYFEPNDDPLTPPNPPRTVEQFALRNDRYKLIDIEEPSAGREFYDLENDPYEECDLAGTTLTPEQLANYDALTSELALLRASFP